MLLVVQPTPFCNIDCSYCYLPDRGNSSRMTLETLAAVVDALQSSGLNKGRLSLVWHGGEPLTLPVEYYADAFSLVRARQDPDAPIALRIQTNGIAINERFCQLFASYDVTVGVSLDGPACIHDARRQTKAGSGTFRHTLRGLRLLQEFGLRPHVISVVTSQTLDRQEEFIEFFLGLGIHLLGLNFEEIENANRESSLAEERMQQRVERFLEDLFVAASANEYLTIREINDYSISLASERDRSQLTLPLSIITVGWNGDFTTFAPELLGDHAPDYPSFVLGNVHDGPVAQALESPRFAAMYADITAGVDACRETCEYFRFCGARFPSNKLAELGTMRGTETLACRMQIKAVTNALRRCLPDMVG
ncbi:MAG: cyclophane-forming radical SAM/SPASM peptide maturase GrrM/OscB [Solirubrobacteraceae bacterium]